MARYGQNALDVIDNVKAKIAEIAPGLPEGVSIQAVYDRWISHYSALWASRLTALKYKLEKEEPMTTETKLRQVYVLYIRTTPEKLWDAIVNPNVGRLADSAQQPQVASGDR